MAAFTSLFPSVTRLPRAVAAGFVALECLFLALFFIGLAANRFLLVVAALAVPVHLFLLVWFFNSNFRLVAFFSALFPFATLALLPYEYAELGLYLGVLGLVVCLMAVDGAFSRSGHYRRAGRSTVVALLVIVLAAMLASVLAWARGWGFRVTHLISLLLVLLAVWVYAVVPDSIAQLRVLVYVLIAAFAAACLTLPYFLQHAGGFATRKTFDTLFGRPNLNLVGMIAAAGVSILLGAVHDSRQRGLPWHLLGMAVLLPVLLFSKSRGAWLGFGVALIYVAVRMRSIKLVVIMAVLAAALLTQDVFRFSLAVRAEQTGTQDPSLLGRFVIWRTAWDVFRSNWLFGVGVENFRHVKFSFGFPRIMDPANWHGTHNMFLEQFVSLGVAGGVAFLLLPLSAFLRLDCLLRRHCASPRGLMVGLNAGLLAFGVHCMFDSPGWNRASFVFWGVLLGLVVAAGRLALSGQECQRSETAEIGSG